MKIHIFTVRNSSTNELIYAEGTSSGSEYCSFFEIEEKWLSDEEKNRPGWRKSHTGEYYYREEVRHLFHYDYQFIKFALEEVEYN
jgi:hypothetical protein